METVLSAGMEAVVGREEGWSGAWCHGGSGGEGGRLGRGEKGERCSGIGRKEDVGGTYITACFST